MNKIVDLCKQLEKQVLKDQGDDKLEDYERAASFIIEKNNF